MGWRIKRNTHLKLIPKFNSTINVDTFNNITINFSKSMKTTILLNLIKTAFFRSTITVKNFNNLTCNIEKKQKCYILRNSIKIPKFTLNLNTNNFNSIFPWANKQAKEQTLSAIQIINMKLTQIFTLTTKLNKHFGRPLWNRGKKTSINHEINNMFTTFYHPSVMEYSKLHKLLNRVFQVFK